MESNQEKPSNEEKAIAFIAKNGTGRSTTLGLVLGMSREEVETMLDEVANRGELTACDVETPSGPARDYRIAGATENPTPFRIKPGTSAKEEAARENAAEEQKITPAKTARQARADQLREQLQVRQAIPARGDGTAKRSARKAKAPAQKRTAMRGRQEQIAELVESRGEPMSLDDLVAAIPDATASAIKQSAKKAADAGLICITGKRKATRYSPAGRAKKAGDASAPKAEEKPRQAPVSRRNKAAPPVPTADGFKCGIFSDGSLALIGNFGWSEDPLAGFEIVTLTPGQVGELSDYLARMGAPRA